MGMKEPIYLITTAPAEEVSAFEIMELYRQRWQVELFFRWLKCLIPCRHWFAHSQEGVQIQIYLCLIQALLFAESLGHKPTKG
jgi:IS4 transposase